MPELPEVETVVRTLENQLLNKTIKDVKVYWPNILDNTELEIFINSLRNETFTKFDRRGKFLIFTLTNYILVAHLRMEGKFFIYKEETIKGKHDHIVFTLNDCYLHYNDTRKFGRFYLYRKNEHIDCLDNLGKEPFDDSLNGFYLKQLTKNNTNCIKNVLLDQSIIAGIGNIYADEILFACQLNPYRKACFISVNKYQEIVENTIKILSKAIMCGGTTIRSYTSSLGVTGRFQLNLKVHSKENEKCDNCSNIVVREKINGRSCFYCPNCQKETTLKVAITGTVGSGKSMVLDMIKKLGFKVESCDYINAQLLEKEEVKQHLATIFNVGVKDLTKQFMAERIYVNASLKKKVEDYLHSLIRLELANFYKENENEKVVFVEVPLLFETSYQNDFDYNILVTSKEEIIKERLIKDRGYSLEKIESIINNQMSTEKKKQLASITINNDSTLSELRKKVEKVCTSIISN